MGKSRGIDFLERHFATVPERGVSQIVSQGNGLGQVFIQEHGPRDGAGDLSDFQCMRKTGTIFVTQGVEEDLGLVFQATKGIGVNDSVAVLLKGRANRTGRGIHDTPAGFGTQAAKGRHKPPFPGFKLLPKGLGGAFAIYVGPHSVGYRTKIHDFTWGVSETKLMPDSYLRQ